MAFNFGSLVPLTFEVRDANGVLSNATTAVLTVQVPDGTFETPGLSNPTVGRYQIDYQPAQSGSYQWHFTTTGLNSDATSGSFDVRTLFPPYIVSLSDVKQYLNMDPTDTSDDDELGEFVEAATLVVEDVVGPVVVRTITEVHQPGRLLALRNRPVLALISVTRISPNPTTYDLTQLDVDSATGIVRPIGSAWGSGSWSGWGSEWSHYPIRSVYTAGRRIVPATMTLAAKVIISHMWETQRGHTQSSRRSRLGVTDPDAVQAGMEFTVRYMIPRRAMELLQRDRRYQVMA